MWYIQTLNDTAVNVSCRAELLSDGRGRENLRKWGGLCYAGPFVSVLIIERELQIRAKNGRVSDAAETDKDRRYNTNVKGDISLVFCVFHRTFIHASVYV